MAYDIEANFKKSDSELYLILANQLIDENLLHFMTPINDDEKEVQSKKWFTSFIEKEKLKKAICCSDFVTEKTKNAEIVASIADTIMGFYANLSEYLSFTLALLILRYGLQKYCSYDNSSL